MKLAIKLEKVAWLYLNGVPCGCFSYRICLCKELINLSSCVSKNLLGTLLSHRIYVTAATEGDKQRIQGGENAKPHEFPSYASLLSGSGARICGGSVIHQDWVVTAKIT